MAGEAGKGAWPRKMDMDRYVRGWERTFGKDKPRKTTVQYVRETLGTPPPPPPAVDREEQDNADQE